MIWHNICTIFNTIYNFFHSKTNINMNTSESSEKALQLFSNSDFEKIAQYLEASKAGASAHTVLAFIHDRQSFLGEQVKLSLLHEIHIHWMIVLMQEFHYEIFVSPHRTECVFLARYAEESFVANFHLPTSQIIKLHDVIITLSEHADSYNKMMEAVKQFLK